MARDGWSRGYCGVTEDGHSDCLTDDRGVWSLCEAQTGLSGPRCVSGPRCRNSWLAAAALCQERCARCPRCAYVSFARKVGECSWFASCDLDRLSQGGGPSVPTFFSRRVGGPRDALAWPRRAARRHDPTEGALPVRLHHIPKTAGSALHWELRRSWEGTRYAGRVHRTPWEAEACYPWFEDEEAIMVVTLRSPRAHVVSQWMECRHSEFGRKSRGARFEALFGGAGACGGARGGGARGGACDAAGLRAWARHFHSLLREGAAAEVGCYDPRNFQVRSLLCTRGNARRLFGSHEARTA
jgi:hypothetical protein